MGMQIAHEEGFWHEIIHTIGDKFGYEWVAISAVVGAVFLFRKRIGKFLQR